MVALKKLGVAAAEAYAAFLIIARVIMFPSALLVGFFASIKVIVLLFPSVASIVPSFLNKPVGMELIAAGILFALLARG